MSLSATSLYLAALFLWLTMRYIAADFPNGVFYPNPVGIPVSLLLPLYSMTMVGIVSLIFSSIYWRLIAKKLCETDLIAFQVISQLSYSALILMPIFSVGLTLFVGLVQFEVYYPVARVVGFQLTMFTFEQYAFDTSIVLLMLIWVPVMFIFYVLYFMLIFRRIGAYYDRNKLLAVGLYLSFGILSLLVAFILNGLT